VAQIGVLSGGSGLKVDSSHVKDQPEEKGVQPSLAWGISLAQSSLGLCSLQTRQPWSWWPDEIREREREREDLGCTSLQLLLLL
jgi:hypothetical protein